MPLFFVCFFTLKNGRYLCADRHCHNYGAPLWGAVCLFSKKLKLSNKKVCSCWSKKTRPINKNYKLILKEIHERNLKIWIQKQHNALYDALLRRKFIYIIISSSEIWWTLNYISDDCNKHDEEGKIQLK